MIYYGKRRLLANVAFVTIFQAGVYLLSFLNFPYLARTLGVADFGIVAFVISVNAYLWLIIDWGFSLGATREVARVQNDSAAISDIFWRTMFAKGVLSIVALAILLAASFFGRTPNPFYVILPGVLNIFGAVFSVDWLMQGLERMGFFAIYSLLTRALIVVLVFVLVHHKSDTWIACALQGLGGFAGGGAGLFLAMRYLKLGRPRGTLSGALREVWDNRHYFLTQSNFIVYTAGGPLVLAFVSGPATVGLYSGAERIMRAFAMVMGPLSTAMYPHINALIQKSKWDAARAAGTMLYIQFICGFLLALLIIFCGPYFIIILLGAKFLASIEIIRYLAFVPLLAALAGTLTKQYLIPLGHREVSTNIILGGAVVYIVFLAIFAYKYGPIGAAISLNITEMFITIMAAIYILVREQEFAAHSLFISRKIM